MKMIGTEEELLIALNAFISPSILCGYSDSTKVPCIEHLGYIGQYHGVPIEIELSEDYHTCSDERLGVAWVHLNAWKWDCLFGQQPEKFDSLRNDEKHKIIYPLMQMIEDEFSHRATSKAWWVHELGKTEDEWRCWYFGKERTKFE